VPPATTQFLLRDFEEVPAVGDPGHDVGGRLSTERLFDLFELGDVTVALAATPPHVVSRRLGHASVAFTLHVYSWVLPGQQRAAADGFAAAVSSAK
jgi:hypothetical protein